MKFWDSSAVIPLLIFESKSERSSQILKKDSCMLVWTLTSVECISALYRRDRDISLDPKTIQEFMCRLKEFEQSWSEIQQVELVRKQAEKLLAFHSLRAADALQLAAAIISFEGNHSEAEFVTYDNNLAKAAIKEGFSLVN